MVFMTIINHCIYLFVSLEGYIKRRFPLVCERMTQPRLTNSLLSCSLPSPSRFSRAREWGEQASETGAVREFICSGEDRQSSF
jgi:hypothetical protein